MDSSQGNTDSASSAAGGEQDARKLLALNPRDADLVFSSQSSYGGALGDDFREHVKTLGQIYQAIQRYLSGAIRRENVYYPELQDVSRELAAYKRSVSDKIPMPTEEQLFKHCICLAAQDPPFIHILREPQLAGKMTIGFATRFVAPTPKHLDKVVVGYRSTITIGLNVLRSFVQSPDFGFDYASWFAAAREPAEVPLQQGRADAMLRKMMIEERSFSTVTGYDVANLRRVNGELGRRLYRPLVTTAVRERVLLAIGCEDLRNSGMAGADRFTDIILFNPEPEIRNRLAALTASMKPDWLAGLIGGDELRLLDAQLKSSQINQLEYFESTARAALEQRKKESEAARDAPLLVEVLKLSSWLRARDKQSAKEAELREARDIVKKIQAAGTLFRLRDHRRLGANEQFVRLMLRGRVPGVLAVTDPFIPPNDIPADFDLNEAENIYVIYKDRKITAKAIETAIELFEKTGDKGLLFSLEELLGVGRVGEAELKEYVAPVFLEKLKRAGNEALTAQLPWWSRLFMWITSSELDEISARRMRAEMYARNARRADRITSGRRRDAQQKAASDTRKLARERVDRKEREESGVIEALDDAGKRGLDLLRERLDLTWDRGLFPVKEDLQRIVQGEGGAAAGKLLGLIDVGAASVREVLRIPVAGGLDVYATRTYLTRNKAELLSRCETKLRNEPAAASRDELVARHNARQRDVYEGLMLFLKKL
ncbi:MAG: hypothetical protein K1X75_15795 [Leptospirales bacterium]|nr:hypothetical protein [Leptospirales bacterium]